MKTKFSTKYLISLVLGATTHATSLASDALPVLTALNAKESSGGANCNIVSESGKVLVDGNVKVNGTLIPVKMLSISSSSKVWAGKNIELTFALPKGKLREKSDGSFSVGASSMGTLKVTYNGATSEMKAKEECSAP